MLSLLKKYQKFFKFCVVGLSGTIIDISVLIFLVEKIGLTVNLANIISFSLAVINNFWFNKLWTFANKDKRHWSQFSKFALTSLVGLLINIILMWLFVQQGINYIISKIMIIGIVVFWNFFINNFWTFRSNE